MNWEFRNEEAKAQVFKGIESGYALMRKKNKNKKKTESHGAGRKRVGCAKLERFYDGFSPSSQLSFSSRKWLHDFPRGSLFLGASGHWVWVVPKLSPRGRPQDLV